MMFKRFNKEINVFLLICECTHFDILFKIAFVVSLNLLNGVTSVQSFW